jgi:hypothetical protein
MNISYNWSCIFLDVKTCSLVYQYWRFMATCCLHLEGINVNWIMEEVGSSEKFALIYRTTRCHLPVHRVRYDNICCHDHVKTYSYRAVTEFVRQTTYVTFQLSLFWEVLYSSNMESIGVRGKIPNSSWYCLFQAFLCIFYSRNTAVRKASMSGNKLIYRLGRGGWEGELWMKRNGITAYCLQLCLPPVELLYNWNTASKLCQRNRHAGNLRLPLQNYFEYILEAIINKVPTLMFAT